MADLNVLDIIVLLRLSYGSGRDILHGFSTAVRRERRRWRLHVTNFELGRAADDVRRLVAEGADGIVAHGLSGGVAAIAAGFPGPVVVIGPRGSNGRLEEARQGPLAFVDADNAAIARAGAAYLQSLGRMRSYAFVVQREETPRAAAFRAALASRREPFRLVSAQVGMDWETPEQVLARQLRDLPKPCAVMAEKDELALLALEGADRAGIRVPREMALIGVDNDELLCEAADPPLSSVAVDHERLGALAEEAMERLFSASAGTGKRGRKATVTGKAKGPGNGESGATFELRAPVRGVVERQSSRPVAPAAALAERAAAFIRHNATNGISSADVVAQLGVSRTLADLRFRQVYGESMLAMILRLRLEAVTRKLAETTLPIGQICAACGFRSESRAKHLFKERFGVSMRQWRARVR